MDARERCSLTSSDDAKKAALRRLLADCQRSSQLTQPGDWSVLNFHDKPFYLVSVVRKCSRCLVRLLRGDPGRLLTSTLKCVTGSRNCLVTWLGSRALPSGLLSYRGGHRRQLCASTLRAYLPRRPFTPTSWQKLECMQLPVLRLLTALHASMHYDSPGAVQG